MNNGKGRFISFEGVDGAGKSTHIQTLAQWLRAHGREVVVTREPGGTPLGEKVRPLILGESMHAETELLLMFALRREHIGQCIEPALRRGAWVISDRFSDASFAYQCGGRGVDRQRFSVIEDWVLGAGVERLEPDLTFLFDLPCEIAKERIHTERVLDRFEREPEDFHERVRSAYLERAQAQPIRFCRVVADQSPEQVERQVMDEVKRRFASETSVSGAS